MTDEVSQSYRSAQSRDPAETSPINWSASKISEGKTPGPTMRCIFSPSSYAQTNQVDDVLQAHMKYNSRGS